MAGAREARLGVGSVLGRSFPIWGRNVVAFALLNVLVYAPLLAYGILAFPTPREDRHVLVDEYAPALLWYGAVLTFGGCLLRFIAPLAVIQGVLEQLRGERATLGGCLRVYVTRLFPTLGAGLLVGVLAFLCAVLGGILAGALVRAGLPNPLAIIVFITPAILVGCVYWVAVPVAAAERRGLLGSLRRSADLTRGSRFAIFLVVVVGLAFQSPPFLVFRVLLPHGGGPAAGWSVLFLTIALGSYGAVATGVAYHDLRAAKDGVRVEDLVRVFA